MPVGILTILLACFGVDTLIGLSSVTFPASVALLVALFFALILCDVILGNRRTSAIVKLIDVPVCLKPLGNTSEVLSDQSRRAFLFDILISSSPHRLLPQLLHNFLDSKSQSSFVLLPLSPPISGIEVGKIIAVFRKFVLKRS